MSDIPLLTNGDDASFSKIFYLPDEKLPPPPPEPKPSFEETLHDFGNALNNWAVDVAVALEPFFIVLAELKPRIDAYLHAVENENTTDKRQHTRQDVENKRRMSRGGKWKAF